MKNNLLAKCGMALALFAGLHTNAAAQNATVPLEKQFTQFSSEEAKPWTFWYWTKLTGFSQKK